MTDGPGRASDEATYVRYAFIADDVFNPFYWHDDEDWLMSTFITDITGLNAAVVFSSVAVSR